MPALILIRGGGDLASGVALRLYRTGLKVIISELEQPLAVRRKVSFAEAVYEGEVEVEGVKARLVKREQVRAALDAGVIPVLVDPQATILNDLDVSVVVDGRLTKRPPEPLPVPVPLHIGLGPGFHAGRNCQAVIETRRSHTLGRVYWDGSTQPDSGLPEGDSRRVLRAPLSGQLIGYAQIGDHVEENQLIAEIHETKPGNHSRFTTDRVAPGAVHSPFNGVLRGLIHPGLYVTAGLKIGDVDPRDDPEMCSLVSDKALAVGGGVLEAILTEPEIRNFLNSKEGNSTQNKPLERNTGKHKSRLDPPFRRFTSILVAIGTVGVFLYSIIAGYHIISVMTVLFFLVLWFLPQPWDWIEFVFSKRPSSPWGRFVLNLFIAILLASMFEDISEIVVKFLRFILSILKRF